MTAIVYILRCTDASYYVGITRTSLDDRVAQHNAGNYDGYTARRRPVILVFAQEFARITDAIAGGAPTQRLEPREEARIG